MELKNNGGSATAIPRPRTSPLEATVDPPDAMCLETPLSGLESEVTRTEEFFIRSHFGVPRIDRDEWRLVVDGDVARPSSFTYRELERQAASHLTALMECAGNSRAAFRPRPDGILWRNGAVGVARWSGIALRSVLERCRPRPTALEVVFEGADRAESSGAPGGRGFAMSVPLAKAMDPDTIIATRMNGEDLLPSHGFPARAIVPGWYGMASVKWLTRIHVSATPFDGYFRTREYAFIYEGDAGDSPKTPVTTIRVKSLVTSPSEGVPLRVGTQMIRGVAWSGHGHIVRVEVGVGAGQNSRTSAGWTNATLSIPESAHAWTHWEVPWQFDRPGFYVIRARAVDAAGNVQPDDPEWNFRGVAANSVHAVPIEVSR